MALEGSQIKEFTIHTPMVELDAARDMKFDIDMRSWP